MIDLTPLDVRKKQGDFRRALRGYDADSVDRFLEQVADRLEEVVRENVGLRERATQLSRSVESYRERERAMNEALISAQQLREATRTQAAREAELTVREAQAEAQRILDEARRQLASVEEALRRVHSQRQNYLRAFRSLLERHLGDISQEEDRLRALLPSDASLSARRPRTRESPAWLLTLDEPSAGKPG
jgi:cell division initiation protein